jgi:hypothetical protein
MLDRNVLIQKAHPLGDPREYEVSDRGSEVHTWEPLMRCARVYDFVHSRCDQGYEGLESKLTLDRQLFSGSMRPSRLILTAANPDSSSVFCLVECEEAPPSNSRDMDIVLLEMHCIGKAYGIIKLDMSAGAGASQAGERVSGSRRRIKRAKRSGMV